MLWIDIHLLPTLTAIQFHLEKHNILEAETCAGELLRHKSSPGFIKAVADTGWLDVGEQSWLNGNLTWAQIHQKITGFGGTSKRHVVYYICFFLSNVYS